MAGPNLSALTASVDFGTVVVAVLSVYAALCIVFVAWKGAAMVIAAVRGDGHEEWLANEERRWGQGDIGRTSVAEQRSLDALDDDLIKSLR